jgi:(p)ppGpp synthase/HD superfamily hydrolase
MEKTMPLNIREFVIYIAGTIHKDQMYADTQYHYHLDRADKVLKDVGFSETSVERIAVWLHDAIEDQGVLRDFIEKLFGTEVADTVWRVTNEAGVNRTERAIKTYPKIAESVRAVAVKLADRIANIEHSIENHSRFALMYLKEDEMFRKALQEVFSYKTRIDLLWKRYDAAIQKVKEIYGIGGDSPEAN